MVAFGRLVCVRLVCVRLACVIWWAGPWDGGDCAPAISRASALGVPGLLRQRGSWCAGAVATANKPAHVHHQPTSLTLVSARVARTARWASKLVPCIRQLACQHRTQPIKSGVTGGCAGSLDVFAHATNGTRPDHGGHANHPNALQTPSARDCKRDGADNRRAGPPKHERFVWCWLWLGRVKPRPRLRHHLRHHLRH